MDFMTAEAARRGVSAQLAYRQADCRHLDAVYDAESFDLIIDKGCLDCFVSGRGHADISAYLLQLRRLLSPAGRLLLLPVNGSHIPTLLATGGETFSSRHMPHPTTLMLMK
jgi:ubiquinone/menaquinone biosynthesis C-methylase UbiE|eukprot:SAG25_NODE_16_length_24288_cov_31.926950_9_plen_111_part_00